MTVNPLGTGYRINFRLGSTSAYWTVGKDFSCRSNFSPVTSSDSTT